MNESVTTPLTWRQLALVVLLAAVGSAVLLQFVWSALIATFRPNGTVIILLGIGFIYPAVVVFGLLVGYSWPRRQLSVHVFVGAAVGLAQWLAILVFGTANGGDIVAFWSGAFWWYAFPSAVIFCSVAIIGDLARKRQLSLNAGLLTGAISLVGAVIGLVSAVYA